MIYLGNKEITNAHIGNKQVNSVYLGNKIIWQNTPKLIFSDSRNPSYGPGGPENYNADITEVFDKPYRIKTYGNSKETSVKNSNWTFRFRNAKTQEWETFLQGSYNHGTLTVEKGDPRYTKKYDAINVYVRGANDGVWRDPSGIWWRIAWELFVYGN